MRLRGALANGGLAAAAVLASLGIGEALVRAFDVGPRFQVVFRESLQPSVDPVLDYELRPSAPDGRERISAAGLRDRDFAVPKPAGVFRIAAIGDSVTYGSGVSRELGWTAQLVARLAALAVPGGAPIEVLNLGVPGYNISQVVERLRVSGLPFDPDVVVYGYVLNDPQAFSLEGAALRDLREAAVPRAGRLAHWLSHSRLYLIARALLAAPPRAPKGRDLPSDPAYAASQGSDRDAYFRALHRDGDSEKRLEQGMAALAGLAREHDARVLVAIFPLFDATGVDASLADVHAEIAALAQASGFHVVDLLPAYQAASAALRRPLRIDFLHPSPFGHRVAAVAILDALCRSGWLPPGAVDCARAAGDPIDEEISRALARAQAR